MALEEVKRNKAMIKSYEAGATIRTLARIYDISPARVHEILVREGAQMRSRGGDHRKPS